MLCLSLSLLYPVALRGVAASWAGVSVGCCCCVRVRQSQVGCCSRLVRVESVRGLE